MTTNLLCLFVLLGCLYGRTLAAETNDCITAPFKCPDDRHQWSDTDPQCYSCVKGEFGESCTVNEKEFECAEGLVCYRPSDNEPGTCSKVSKPFTSGAGSEVHVDVAGDGVQVSVDFTA